MQNDNLTYYTQPGPMTDPGPYAHLFDGLPTDLSALVKTLQGVMVHIFWAEAYGLKLTDERKAEVNLRTVDKQLARILELDDRPLTEARSHDRKLVGNCRDFSVMLAAILRHQGIPARARCGFGTYFIPGHYEDHWVCEYWNAAQSRWILVDAQLDAMMQEALKLDFDPLDTPRNRFIVGGDAWQLCRSGAANPDDFGIFEWHGMEFVRGDLLRDFLAFSKVEILPWDGGWGYLVELAPEQVEPVYALMDRVAALIRAADASGSAADDAALRALYDEDANFHPPF
ncbi:MAG TPA: transglutaminase-like domain-containing protein [Anaerolineae bacterium]|nr:transglutaminase-like domain-containing protein [Anaerolineae bacterium]